MERKLKLKPKLKNEVQVKVRVLPPTPRVGVAQTVEAASVNLRLLLQTQYSPPSARSNGSGRIRWVAGSTPARAASMAR